MTVPRRFPASQPQRTDLAWRRTALTAAAVGGVAFRAATSQHRAVDVVTAAVAFAAAAAIYLCGRLRAADTASHAVIAVIAAAAVACAATGVLVLMSLCWMP